MFNYLKQQKTKVEEKDEGKRTSIIAIHKPIIETLFLFDNPATIHNINDFRSMRLIWTIHHVNNLLIIFEFIFHV